jgi:hypothetical protein
MPRMVTWTRFNVWLYVQWLSYLYSCSCTQCPHRSALIRQARSWNVLLSPCSTLQSYQRVSSHSRVFRKQVFGKIDKLPTTKAVKGLGCMCFLPTNLCRWSETCYSGEYQRAKELRVTLSREKKGKKEEDPKTASRPYDTVFADDSCRVLVMSLIEWNVEAVNLLDTWYYELIVIWTLSIGNLKLRRFGS